MNFSSLGQIFSSPIILGVFGFVILVIFIVCGYAVYAWFKGGHGKFAKSQARYQKCISITGGNKLSLFNLKALGDYAVNEVTLGWHMLDPDALIPDLDTGEYYLPIDERDAIPLFPLNPELREQKEKELSQNLDKMAKGNCLATIARVTMVLKQEEESARRNFALAASFGILLLIVGGVIATRIF